MSSFPVEQAPPISDDEISLLDLLVVIAENIRLLVIGPVLIGLSALGISFVVPQTFESTSVLMAEKASTIDKPPTFTVAAVASLITSSTVLDPVAQTLGLTEGRSVESARRLLREQIKPAIGKQDKLLTLVTEADTPERARQLNQAVLDAVLEQTRPRGTELLRLQSRLEQERALQSDAKALEAVLVKQVVAGGAQGDTASRALSEVMRSASERLGRIQALEAQLEGLTAADLVQSPTLPEKPIKPKKSLIAVLASLASGFALLLFVFVRNAWRSAGQNPEAAAKLDRIGRSMPFGRKG